MPRQMVFKMERPGLLKELPSNVYYTIDPSLAMSANYPFRERMAERKGVVLKVEENDRGYYVTAEFDPDKQ